jgi:hypothetical protein
MANQDFEGLIEYLKNSENPMVLRKVLQAYSGDSEGSDFLRQSVGRYKQSMADDSSEY